MSTPEDGGGTVRYNVKDLLGAIDRKLDRVIETLGDKANRADVHELKGRVSALEKQAEVARMLALDRAQTAENRDRNVTRKQQFVNTFAALASTVAILVSGAHWFHFH